jgi:hypothetical protein
MIMTFTRNPNNWRDGVRASEIDHWERVHAREAATARQADDAGVTYRYIPWTEARGRQNLKGQKVSSAYWTRGFGELPWGHQHAHTYAFAFKEVTIVGHDFLAFADGTSESFISYDTVCVQESRYQS